MFLYNMPRGDHFGSHRWIDGSSENVCMILSTYPKALGNLRKLKSLQLWGNLDALEKISLDSVPIMSFKNIQSIRIPREIGKLKNLKDAVHYPFLICKLIMLLQFVWLC
ncbi:hypothetical protein BC829DRAFT_385862 [Chytridium lagenaria]|nr:hypothetical protein BC829DRAFT_385862 [Chytridium lagenaria]